MHAADLIVQAIHVWERFGGLLSNCAAEKSSCGGISGAIVELLRAESRLDLLVEGREQRLDDKRRVRWDMEP